MKRALFALTCALASCASDPQPCDTLCESAGYQNISETEEGCFCATPEGLGGQLDASGCETYCDAIGADPDDAVLTTTETANDTCLCPSAP